MVQGPAPEFYLASMEDLYHKEESYNQWVAKLASCCTPIACSLCTLCVCVVSFVFFFLSCTPWPVIYILYGYCFFCLAYVCNTVVVPASLSITRGTMVLSTIAVAL